ncbi:hypothetical protein ID866_1227 [Astraeus odoratus]|nr:hypothetical protein ID866_1227 [Astraeus odoratus]
MPSVVATSTQAPMKIQESHPAQLSSKQASRPQTGAAGEKEVVQAFAKRPPPTFQQPPPSQDQVYTKKVPHRSGKPIINWFQRKLAGTVKTRRVRDEISLLNDQQTGTNAKGHRNTSVGIRPTGRSVSSPLPHHAPTSAQKPGAAINRRALPSTAPHRRTISLNDTDTDHVFILPRDEESNADAVTRRSSLARDSMWSPASAVEADEDASLRPIPPSAPPSPSPSHSSSSYLSNPRTFRSVAASTKPTTVLSIDLPPAGIGHIAQVPPTPTQLAPRHAPHARSSSTSTSGGVISSGASITFSALPPSPQSQPPPGIYLHSGSTSSATGTQVTTMNGLQAPLHTAHHPRNNPRPWSPPPDNASVLTLASSAFAFPGARMTMGSMGSTVFSGVIGARDSISHLGGSVVGDAAGDPEGENMSQFILGEDNLDVEAERDADASLRALRPRSSRRCSWGSEVSGWSAKVLGNGAGISTGSRSLWTSYSLKTGEPRELEDDEGEDAEEIEQPNTSGVQENSEQPDQDHVRVEGEGDHGRSDGGPADTGTPPAEDVSPTLGRSGGRSLLEASSAVQASPPINL